MAAFMDVRWTFARGRDVSCLGGSSPRAWPRVSHCFDDAQHAQYVVAIAAVLRAGFVVVNVNPLYTPRELSIS